MKPIENIVETAIYAEDLEAAETFYRAVLGLALWQKKQDDTFSFKRGRHKCSSSSAPRRRTRATASRPMGP